MRNHDMAKIHVELDEKPDMILTQLGLMSCLPKLKRGETQPRSKEHPNGYTKRRGKKTTNPLPTDK